MYIVNLETCRDEHDSSMYTFQVKDSVANPEEALRNAINEYLQTKKGQNHIKKCKEFNWYDAMENVPERIWNKHGLKYKNVKSVNINVYHYEVLASATTISNS